ncbi:MAG TPA: hypothetical protein VJT73_21890 [Polyangiaceae bacterium]|nr:hypothetical protein [Polyangiaceae bacterium]
MAPAHPSRVESSLSELFEVQKKARHLAAEIASGPPGEVMDALARAIERARGHEGEDDRVLELETISQVLAQLEGPRAVDMLVDVLGSEDPLARHAAGVVLEEVAFERFKEVALGVERALAQLPADHLALAELPYLLIEIPEPGVSRLIHRFLEHSNEEVVAAGIEACVELGDSSSIPRLLRLEADTRLVELDDEDDLGPEGHEQDGSVTIGELAKEARLMLEAQGSEDDA